MAAYIPTIATVTVAVFTAVFGIFSYRTQKKTDRQVELRNRRVKEYENYLAAYANGAVWSQENNSEEMDEAVRKEYWQAYSTLFHIASDRVLIAAADFHAFAWRAETNLTGEEWDRKFKELYATIIIEMRREAFEETKLPRNLVEEHIPFAM